jgi:hypothetical protein
MRLLPEPEPLPLRPLPEHRGWAWLVLGAAALAALAARGPWLEVRFQQLFGHFQGPPAWNSTVGFTCLCSSLLVLVLTLAESDTPAARRAVRPGSLLVVAIALLSLLLWASGGPGLLRGVSARWTGWFYLAATCLPLLFGGCLRRWLSVARREP